LQEVRVLPMTGDDMMRPQRRFSQRNAEQGIKFGGKTEHICGPSTIEADLENLARALSNKPLKPPARKAR
jgi:hypothetical protein